MPNCRAHHPSINLVVECITRACHDMGVAPYQEVNGDNAQLIHDNVNEDACNAKNIEKGTGQLRYVGVNVARGTGGVQITLVWNGPPPSPSNDGNGVVDETGAKSRSAAIDDPDLAKLATKLISMSNSADCNEGSSNVEEGAKSTAEETETKKIVLDANSAKAPPANIRR